MKNSKFDIADYLDNQEMIDNYLNEVLENGNENDLACAIENIAKAIAEKSRLNSLTSDDNL